MTLPPGAPDLLAFGIGLHQSRITLEAHDDSTHENSSASAFATLLKPARKVR
ncbi:hypothetical protein OCH239_13785 [Roseivivax halodurans JCM 10272]|uniref:Uncharacterized protein n=1 Tax=Roseivivax halodurans JCM 10272 TaxID=1449350 RepID=X7EIG3_9RHOB|nr:hypothetical protein OCH239_13785 [Roseivivax halodurans JCM 10272]